MRFEDTTSEAQSGATATPGRWPAQSERLWSVRQKMLRFEGFKLFILAFTCSWMVQLGAVHGVEPDEVLKDAGLEARARALSAGLRCVVCQNQSIDDSDAPLAKDLRRLVRDRLKAGDSDEQVNAYIVARYGTFVLLKPPFKTNTLLLWLLPFALAVFAVYAAYRALFRARAAPDVPNVDDGPVDGAGARELSDDEQKKLDALLKASTNENA